jgi:hypothetical protein
LPRQLELNWLRKDGRKIRKLFSENRHQKNCKTFPSDTFYRCDGNTKAEREVEIRKVMQRVLQQTSGSGRVYTSDEELFGRKIGFFGSLFGCWHRRLSKPIGDHQTCLECGARKKFDKINLTTSGRFYYPPSAIAQP